MFNIGTQELLIILLLVFLLFGPRHLPEVAHTLGKGLGDLRRALQGVEDNVRKAGAEIPSLPRHLLEMGDDPPRHILSGKEESPPVILPPGTEAPVLGQEPAPPGRAEGAP